MGRSIPKKKYGTGRCLHCEHGVLLDSRNYTRTHQLVRRGKQVGRCPGSRQRVQPELVAVLRTAVQKKPKTKVCPTCGQESRWATRSLNEL